MKFLQSLIDRFLKADDAVTTVGRNNAPLTFKDSMEGSEVAQAIFNIVREESYDGKASGLLREFYSQIDAGKLDEFLGENMGRKTGEKQHERDLNFTLPNNENCGQTVHQVVNEVFARLILEKKGAFKAIGSDHLYAEGMNTVKIEGMRRWDKDLVRSFGMENLIEMNDEQADRLQYIPPKVLEALGGENCKNSSVNMLQGIQGTDPNLITSFGPEYFVQLSDEQRQVIYAVIPYFDFDKKDQEALYLQDLYKKMQAIGGKWIVEMDCQKITYLLKETYKAKESRFDPDEIEFAFDPNWLQAMGGEVLSQLDTTEIYRFSGITPERIDVIGGGRVVIQLDKHTVDRLLHKDRNTGEYHVGTNILKFLGEDILQVDSESLGYIASASDKLLQTLGKDIVIGLGANIYMLCENDGPYGSRYQEMSLANICAFGPENFLEMRNSDKVNWVRKQTPWTLNKIGAEDIIAMSIAELETGNTSSTQVITSSTKNA